MYFTLSEAHFTVKTAYLHILYNVKQDIIQYNYLNISKLREMKMQHKNYLYHIIHTLHK